MKHHSGRHPRLALLAWHSSAVTDLQPFCLHLCSPCVRHTLRRLTRSCPLCPQERERAERERVVRQKVAASTFARGYLSGIVNTVFGRLQQTGYFYDPLLKEVEESFMPWLKEQAVSYLERGVVARQVRVCVAM